MQISIENLPKSEVKFTITLSRETTEKFMKKAAEQVATMVKIPGFRPGKAPLDVLKKNVKEGVIEAHMIDLAVPETYSKAVKEKDVKVISKAEIKVVQDDPLIYEAQVAVYPEVKVSGYEKIKIKPQDDKVADKDVETALENIQKQNATFEEAKRASKIGDKVEIDFEGFDEGGAQIESTQSKNHPLVLGEGTMVPGFEEALVDMSKDEEKKFKIGFPKNYFHKAMQGKKVEFKVKMNTVLEIKMPEFTPEFLEKISGKKQSLEEVKDIIRKNLEHEKKHSERVRMEDEFLGKIAEMVKVDVPNAILEEELDGMIEEFKNQLEQKGITLQQYLENVKKELKDLREERQKEAEKRIRLRFALQQIFDQEKIEATEEDMKKELDHIMSLYPEGEKEKLKDEYKKGSYLKRRLENKIKMDKLFALYLFK